MADGRRQSSKGVQVRKECLLQGDGTPAGAGGAFLELHRLQPAALAEHLLLAFGPLEVEVRQAPLKIEVGLDEGLPRLTALDLLLPYAQSAVYDPRPVRT